MRTPIYHYDHFGDSGYITLPNFEKEKFYNFSGRNFNRKISAAKIAAELISGYSSVLQQAPALKERAIKNYLLSANIDKIMQIIQQSQKTEIPQSSENLMFIQYCKFIIEQCSVYLYQIKAL